MDLPTIKPPLNVWELIKQYWRSEHRKSAYILYTVMVILTMAVVVTEVAITYWANYFYNALQAYDKAAAIRLLGVFFLIAFTYIALAVSRYYVSQIFGLRWRRWLTGQLINRWLRGRGYYYLETFDIKTDNPDQRIQDDAGALVSYSIELSISFIGNAMSVIGYTYVLWSLSGVLAIPLGSLGTLHITGYLVWVSIIYSLIGTLITFKIGRPLVNLNFQQQSREATFRFAAMDLRSHAEDVALYHGERHQASILQKLFGSVLENWYAIIIRQTKLLWFTAGFAQLSVALPFIVVLPNYFAKVILLGGLMQSLRAFNALQDSMAFFVNAFTTIAVWRATGQRLTTFLNHLDDVENKADQETHLIVNKKPENTISATQLSIRTPQDELLLKNIGETFEHGSNYLIKGVSGIGKSTFIRTMAGIWPFASGNITLPSDKRVMYLPQQPYMPIGTLAEAILFPDKSHPANIEKLKAVMRECRLEQFIPRLDEEARWSEQLSPGEQQRVAFARVLLQSPDWVFMDECTSSLDLENERFLYQMLKTKLPSCSFVSVGHRPTLDEYHDHIINMAKYSEKYGSMAYL